MSIQGATIASINVVDDPGNRTIHAWYRGLMYVTAGVNNFDLWLKLDGTGVQAWRWSPGYTTELNVTLSKVMNVGPGVHTITVQFVWGDYTTGTPTNVSTFGDPNFNVLEYIVLPAGGT